MQVGVENDQGPEGREKKGENVKLGKFPKVVYARQYRDGDEVYLLPGETVDGVVDGDSTEPQKIGVYVFAREMVMQRRMVEIPQRKGGEAMNAKQYREQRDEARECLDLLRSAVAEFIRTGSGISYTEFKSQVGPLIG